MIPYLKKELLLLYRNVLEIIIQPDILSNLTGLHLTKIDFSDRKFCLKGKDMHIGFAAECEIKDLLKKDLVSINDVKEIKNDAAQFIIALMKKIFGRCPLGSVVIRNADVFDRNYMLNKSSATLKTKLQKLLHHLISLKIINTTTAQETLKKYMDILRNEEEKFLSFKASQRLDEFFFSIVSLENVSKEFTFVFKLILTLSHGQACVERGFSINNTVLLTNMKPNPIIARKTIMDHMQKNDLKPHNLFLSSKLFRSVKAARTWYSEFLKEQEENEIEKEKATQFDIIPLETSEIRLKQYQYKKIAKV